MLQSGRQMWIVPAAEIDWIEAADNYSRVHRCSLARRLGLQVVAEGIETAEQLAMLKSLDCHFGQGFYFSSAIDGESASAWIERAPRW